MSNLLNNLKMYQFYFRDLILVLNILYKINPNSFPLNQRENIGNLLAAEIYNYLINGGQLSAYRTNKLISGKTSDKE